MAWAFNIELKVVYSLLFLDSYLNKSDVMYLCQQKKTGLYLSITLQSWPFFHFIKMISLSLSCKLQYYWHLCCFSLLLLLFHCDGGREYLGRAWLPLGHPFSSMGLSILLNQNNEKWILNFPTKGGSTHFLLCTSWCLGSRRKVRKWEWFQICVRGPSWWAC